MIISIILIALGLFSAFYLFCNFPYAPLYKINHKHVKISVIIPARNEETNLGYLLSDLNAQSLSPYEVICVDDCSTDNTTQVAQKYGCKIINIKEKPENWIGKSYACQLGADEALGDFLLFLDADVRLGKNGLMKILCAYQKENCTVSFQPRHIVKNLYENFSLFFNLIQYAANGLGIKGGQNIGLIGPVIFISKRDYNIVGGHSSIKESVIDDISLGVELKKHEIPFKLFLGDNDIYFRMYSGGFLDLFRGWMKNIASGAVKTPIVRFILIFLFITSSISVPLNLITNSVELNVNYLIAFIALYFLWVLFFIIVARKIGNFNIAFMIFYPIPLFMFLLICIISFLKKLLHIKTDWKGRKV